MRAAAWVVRKDFVGMEVRLQLHEEGRRTESDSLEKRRRESIPNNPMMTFNKTVKDILALGQGRLGKTQNH